MDELKAKQIIDAELLKQKYVAEANSRVRTLTEKLTIVQETLTSRESELEFLTARLEELEMSATSQST